MVVFGAVRAVPASRGHDPRRRQRSRSDRGPAPRRLPAIPRRGAGGREGDARLRARGLAPRPVQAAVDGGHGAAVGRAARPGRIALGLEPPLGRIEHPRHVAGRQRRRQRRAQHRGHDHRHPGGDAGREHLDQQWRHAARLRRECRACGPGPRGGTRRCGSRAQWRQQCQRATERGHPGRGSRLRLSRSRRTGL